MSNINVMRKNLGPVTAYKYAVQQGYTGTEQEFATLMASYATVAEEAEAAKDDAIDAKTAAEEAQAAAEAAAEQAEVVIGVDDTLSVEGRAADAKVTGDRVNNLINSNSFDLMRLFGTFTSRTSGGITYTWNEDNTVCTAVGTTTAISVANLYSGDTLPVGIKARKKYHIKCTTTNPNLLLEIIAYNGSSNIMDNFITEDIDYTVPENATKLTIRIRTRHTSSDSSTVNDSISVGIYAAKTNKELENDIDLLGAHIRRLDYPEMQYMQIFPKYTTIGDSLMGGFMNRDGISISTATAKDAGNNWVNYISLRTGRIFTNLAVGGSTAKLWRDELISGANVDTDCYLVGLGVNDHRNELAVGNNLDIKDDFHNNADSFYGNYDYILRQLMAWNENAHIFCFTIPAIEGGTSTNYNTAIKAVTALYPAKVHCINLAEDYAEFLNSSIVADNYTGGHFNPVAYNYMSTVIERAINDYINNNDELFATAPYA